MAFSTSRPVWHERWRLAALWLGILTGPAVWLALLETNFVLAFDACRQGSAWQLHATIAAATLAVAASGYLAWRAAQGNLTDDATAAPLSDETRRQRTHWMRLAGLAFSSWFLLVILAMEVPLLILGECQ